MKLRSLLNSSIIIFIDFLFVSILFPVKGLSNEKSIEIYDLSRRWLIHEQHWVPYIEGYGNGSTSISLIIYKGEFDNSDIRISYPYSLQFFINDRYFDSFDQFSTRLYPLDSVFRHMENDTLWISFFSKNGLWHLLDTKIVKDFSPDERSAFKGDLNIQSRHFSHDHDLLIIAFLILVFVISITLNYDYKTFRDYSYLLRVFKKISTDSLIDRGKFISGSDLLVFTNLSLGLSLISLLISFGKINPPWIKIEPSVSTNIFFWFMLFILFFFWLLFRIRWAQLITRLYNLRDIRNIHIFESLRITHILILGFSMLAPLLIFGFRLDSDVVLQWLSTVVIWAVIFRVLIVAIKILNSSTHKIIYIISYLCTSEIIPLVIGLRVMLDASIILKLL